MEQEYLSQLTDGIKMFMDMANWAFIAFFMIWTIILNMTVKKSLAQKQEHKAVKALNKVPKAYWVLLQGFVLSGVWAYFFRLKTREEFAGLFFSITISMVIWKMGLQKIISAKTPK